MRLDTEAIRAAAAAARSAESSVVETLVGAQRIRWRIKAPTTADTLATTRPHIRRAYPEATTDVLRAYKDGKLSEASARQELQVLAYRLAEAAEDSVLQYAHLLAGVTGWEIEQPDGTWVAAEGRVVDRPEDCPAGIDYLTLADLLALPVQAAPGIVHTVAAIVGAAIHRLAADKHGRAAASFASFRLGATGPAVPAGEGLRGDGDGSPSVGPG